MGLKVGHNPISNKIYAGTVRNNLWEKNKTDVTKDAIFSVIAHALKVQEASGGYVMVIDDYDDKTVEYLLKVERVEKTKGGGIDG